MYSIKMVNVENPLDLKHQSKMAKKPIFMQPTMFKMSMQESEMISDDEMDVTEGISGKKSIKQVAEKSLNLS